MRERTNLFFRRYWLAFAIVFVFLLMWWVLWSIRYSRVAITTMMIAPDLFGSPVSALRIVGEDPVREEVWLDVPKGRGLLVADVYRPKDGDVHGGMLIAVGAAPEIRDHPGVIRLSTTAARAGIVVMIPELYYPFYENALPEDVNGLVSAFGTNVEEIIASYQWLRDQPYVDPDRLGIFGASAGAGLGLVSASDPRISHDLGYFAALGTYYDLVDLVSAITTDSIQYKGRTEPWEPWLTSVRVLYNSVINYLPDANDRHILSRIFVDEDDSARRLVGRLSPRARDVYEALDDRDVNRILQFWGEVSPQDVASLREVSPSNYVQALDTDLFIMHDRSDPYIPYVESRRLRDATAGNGHQVYFAEFDFLNHVEPKSPSNPISFMADMVKLIFYSWLLMLKML